MKKSDPAAHHCRPLRDQNRQCRPLIDMMEKTALQARNLARAAKVVDEMVADKYCGIILTLAGLIPAGQKCMIQRGQTGQP